MIASDLKARGPPRTRRGRPDMPIEGCDLVRRGYRTAVFCLFSNRLGCLGSLVVSAILTLILLLMFDVL